MPIDTVRTDGRRAGRSRAAASITIDQAVEASRARRERRAVGSFGLMTEARDPHDCYETPPEAVEMLITNLWRGGENIGKVWDPSCGRGAIVKYMLEQSYVKCGNSTSFHSQEVVGADKYVYEPLAGIDPNHLLYGQDFNVDFGHVPVGTRVIIMNPPYKLADEHVRHAINLMHHAEGTVCALLRLTWIAALKRRDLLGKLSHMIICGRLKMLPPDVEDRGHSGTVDFAWFVFSSRDRHALNGATRIIRA